MVPFVYSLVNSQHEATKRRKRVLFTRGGIKADQAIAEDSSQLQ